MKKTIIMIVIGILSVATIGTVMSSSGEDEREDDGRYQNQRESDDRERCVRPKCLARIAPGCATGCERHLQE